MADRKPILKGGWWWDWWAIVVGGNLPPKVVGKPFGKFSKAGRTLLQSPSGWAAMRKMAKLCTPRRGNHVEEFASIRRYIASMQMDRIL